MATNLSAPVTEDIWHLSIDDLLSPLPEKPRLGGPGPFVINLSSSTAGIGLPSLNLAGCESAHAYEIQRTEDGRTRYRLRLGPFETEEEADLILSMVREIYPSALTATAGTDDLKSIAAIRAKAAAAADARRPPAPPKQPEPPVVFAQPDPIDAALKAVASRPSTAIAPKPQAAPAALSAIEALTLSVDLSIAEILPPKRPEAPSVTVRAKSPVSIDNAAPKIVEPPLVTERVEFAPVKKVSAPAYTAPATPAVLKPVVPAAAAYVAPAAPSLPKQPASIWEPLPVAPRSVASKFAPPAARPAMSVSAPLIRRAAAPAAAPSALKAAAPALPAKPSTPQNTSATTAAAASAPAAAAVKKSQPAPRIAVPVEKHLDFDSTQTMRALTPKELADENALPWFVIELATSTEAFDPDTVPNLDIFAEYRLYSVAETGTGRIVHSLRVGFFGAEIAAKAVASYLAEYYEKAAIKRVSFAERERFAEQVVEARKDVGATGRHAVIEITDDLVARRRRFIANAQPASPAP